MADDLPPLPPGYYLDPNQAATQDKTFITPPLSTPSQGPAAPPLPPGYHATPEAAQAAAPPPPQQIYRGAIVPWGRYASGDSGQNKFDPHAGILGAAIDAFNLPGDVLTGKQPTPYTGGAATADPDLLRRAENLAAFMSPTPAADAASRPNLASAQLAPNLTAAAPGILSKVANIAGSETGKLVGVGLGGLLGHQYGMGELGGMAGSLVGDVLKGWGNRSGTLDPLAARLRAQRPSLLNQTIPPLLNESLGAPSQFLQDYQDMPPNMPLYPQSQPAATQPGSAWLPDPGRRRYAPLPKAGPIPEGLLGPWA